MHPHLRDFVERVFVNLCVKYILSVANLLKNANRAYESRLTN